MTKKNYIQPAIEVNAMNAAQNLMSASILGMIMA